jgi:hypothetical protein
MNRLMKLTVWLIILGVAGIVSCGEKKPTPISDGANPLRFRGVVFTGFMKVCPYGLNIDGREYGLDVVSLPDEILDKSCEVEADSLTVHHDGFDLLSGISINGTRYLTGREWHKQQDEIHKNDPDPLD